jgi:hypothetical protein
MELNRDYLLRRENETRKADKYLQETPELRQLLHDFVTTTYVNPAAVRHM